MVKSPLSLIIAYWIKPQMASQQQKKLLLFFLGRTSLQTARFWISRSLIGRISIHWRMCTFGNNCFNNPDKCSSLWVTHPLDYSGALKSRLVWIKNGQKSLGCKWLGFLMGSEIPKPNHLKSRQKRPDLE